MDACRVPRAQTPSGTVDAATWSPDQFAGGVEQYDNTNKRCYTVLGVVPWSTLGTPETDSWGRRFTYRVSAAFADDASLNTWQTRLNAVPGTFTGQNTAAILSPADQNPTCPSSSPPAVAPYVLSPAPGLSSFALCSLGDIAAFTRDEASHSPSSIGSALPALFVSHGRNGYGAYQPTGVRVAGPNDGDGDGVPDQDADEAANAAGTTKATPSGGYLSWAFYSRNPAPESSACSDTSAGSPLCEFDDIAYLISGPTLIARMVSAGRLP